MHKANLKFVLDNGDEWISDDSSFYGDYTQKQDAIQRGKEQGVDVEHYWEAIHPRLPSVIAHNAISIAGTEKPRLVERYNPYEGTVSARQLNEPVTDFLKRLPPLDSALVGPWLWCANPFAEVKHDPEEKSEKGIQLAANLLQAYEKKKADIKAVVPDITAAALTRNLGKDRTRLREGILDTAKQNGMTCGKWMLFPALEDVPRFWKAIVEGTVRGNLGIGAKIATETDVGRDPNYRLICIYTKDFSDVKDLQRVVHGLLDLNLISGGGSGRPIYYKPDVYTFLGIESGNAYGLRASLYSGHEILKLHLDPEKKRSSDEAQQPPNKRQQTLGLPRKSAAKSGSAVAG